MNKFMKESNDLANKGMENGEGGPFGAVIVDKEGEVVSTGNNKVLKEHTSETLEYTEDPIVSSDVIGRRCGSLVDALSTNVLEVDGKQLVKVVSWYDNEMSYTAQMVRTAKYLMTR